ncbi:hypothetical protein BD560DRAFT_449626 [Blakeslea trispora]|nr:hypothetical protein BD560DRAFT_449626 [Blakeslea trispora]
MKLIAVSSIALVFLNQVLAKPAEGCLQNHTIIANETCTSVAMSFKLTEEDFYQMNPGLHHSEQHSCDNLDVGKPYCVCMNEPCTPESAVTPPVNSTSSEVPSVSNVAQSSSAVASASSVVSSSQTASIAPAGSSVPAGSSAVASSAAVSPAASAPSDASKSTSSAASQSGKPTSGAVTVGTAINALTFGAIMAGASLFL